MVFILRLKDSYSELDYGDLATAEPGALFNATVSDEEEGLIDNFAVHLQFLEEFFRVVLPGIDFEALEYLNNIIVEL